MMHFLNHNPAFVFHAQNLILCQPFPQFLLYHKDLTKCIRQSERDGRRRNKAIKNGSEREKEESAGKEVRGKGSKNAIELERTSFGEF